MLLTKDFVKNCRKVGVLREFLLQAIDQIDAKDRRIAKLEKKLKELKEERNGNG